MSYRIKINESPPVTDPSLASESVKQIIGEQLALEAVDATKTLEQQGADSLDAYEIALDMDEVFDLGFVEDEELERIIKLPINEIILWLESQLAQ